MKKSSAILAVLRLKLLLSFCISAFFAASPAAFGQGGQQHYNSPLYAPRTYDPAQTTSNGLPKTLQEVGIEQRLNEPLPLETEFKDENGKTVRLGEYFGTGRPVILALVYYECPMLCNEVLNGLTGSLKGNSLNAGKDFDVVAISFDAREYDKPELAKNKKAGYMRRYERPGTENGWHFLTGRQESIDAVAQAVGFKYHWDEKTQQFAHAGGIMMATPEGRLSRYFYGIDYAPIDLKLGLMDSAQNKIGTATDKLMLYCFHYDPATGTYGFAVFRALRFAGVLTLLGIGAMLFVFWRKNKKKVLVNA
ncbi:MAG TPA: SCO family protein [Pyrinomonadaceae bacterium]|nr:SCO family protein [Pyrinomonadaceae bacterium]